MEYRELLEPGIFSYVFPNVTDEETLLFYGKPTLRAALRGWRRQEKMFAQILERKPKTMSLIQIAAAEQELTKCRRAISELRQLIPLAERRPPLPGMRPTNWFKPGEKVYCRLHSRDPYAAECRHNPPNPLVIGRVEGVDANRHIVVDLQSLISENGFYQDANYSHHHVVKYVDLSPLILHEWEHHDLMCNSEFRALWCNYCHPNDREELTAFLS